MKRKEFAAASRRRFLVSAALGAVVCAATFGAAGAAQAQEYALRQVKGFAIWSPVGQADVLRITRWLPDPASGGSFDFEIMSKDIVTRDEGYLVQAKPIGGGIAEGVMHAHYPGTPNGSLVTYRVQVLAADVAGGPPGWNKAGDIRWSFTKDNDKESDWFYGRNMDRHDVADL